VSPACTSSTDSRVCWNRSGKSYTADYAAWWGGEELHPKKAPQPERGQ
jgi:hypothetical protein